jgi:hypothetical protein
VNTLGITFPSLSGMNRKDQNADLACAVPGDSISGLPVVRALVCSAVFVLRGLGSIGKNRSAELSQLPAKHCD